MTASFSRRLDGLEPDNLLAFLALLGMLRSLEADDQLRPPQERSVARVAWDINHPPLRPRLFLNCELTDEDVMARVASGLDLLAAAHEFDKRRNLDYSRSEARTLLIREAVGASAATRHRVDILSALMSDAAIKDDKDESVDPTPLCLLFGQGHQYFLDRLANVSQQAAPPPRGRGKDAIAISASECLSEALFRPWHRDDSTFSFRWDPEEDVRYALMAGDPTDATYKTGTQHGANRLAAVGLAALTLVPEVRLGRVRPRIVGGNFDAKGFSFAWPIWSEPASLAAICALLAHPALRSPNGMVNLGVDHVLVARRISVGKFTNFSRARPV